ncbi:hypothetical protein CKO35_17200 [Ectothiorhodospira shaposhnikovii]|uniref:DUF3325 family protein n=1 Tax=Ectothiorhodospira shaposhnikovii TaxID=1054 RepID=UPI001908F08A|nr:DUF3325 family protein [Ectothiorhodospira shaposhnikovii]MBK1674980.1 hypothetical protein [Ectothiorhodospira shaposhnikovii]
MNEALWLLLAALTALLGMAWLALAMPMHWKQVFTHTAVQPSTAILRLLGCLSLLVSACCCVMADSLSMAVLVWLMLLAGAAFMVAMLLARYPTLLRIFWP